MLGHLAALGESGEMREVGTLGQRLRLRLLRTGDVGE